MISLVKGNATPLELAVRHVESVWNLCLRYSGEDAFDPWSGMSARTVRETAAFYNVSHAELRIALEARGWYGGDRNGNP